MSVTIADIEAARRTIAGPVLRTPMLPAPKLSALTGADVFVKYENLQVTNSFKDRGALNKLASLGAAARARGRDRHVRRQPRPGGRLSRRAAADPGDHRDAGDHAVREGRGDAAYGAEVVLEGETVAEAQVRAEAIARERALTFVPSLRRSAGDRGQGTIALEMLEETSRPRHAGDPDRRRRADRRQRHRRARAQAGDRDRRGRSRALSVVLERAHRRETARSAARPWRKASR